MVLSYPPPPLRIPGQYEEIRREISALVNVSSLPVHRLAIELSPEEEFVRFTRNEMLPLDQLLTNLVRRLERYRVELTQKTSKIPSDFERGVLASILYDGAFDTFQPNEIIGLELGQEKQELVKAYRELGALDGAIEKKIDDHIAMLTRSITTISGLAGSGVTRSLTVDDILPFPLLRRTQHIIKLSLDSEERKSQVLEPVSRFVSIVKSFIMDKEFNLTQTGELIVQKGKRRLPIEVLSSGEKQLLILLTETLLQGGKPFVFIADEPELSLHIEWQAKIIASIKELNPQSQVIVATHSPEVAGSWKDCIIDMEDVVSGG